MNRDYFVKIWAVAQFCILFSLFLSAVGYPYLGEHYQLRSRTRIYEYVLDLEEKKFPLPKEEKENLVANYRVLQEKINRSGWKKAAEGLRYLLIGISPWLHFWWTASLVLTWYLLKQRDGVHGAIWILPLLLCFHLYWQPSSSNEYPWEKESALFPDESTLLAHYRGAPLEGGIAEQRRELRRCWEDYLVEKWGGEEPSREEELRRKQVETASFRFHVARLQIGSPLQNRDLQWKGKGGISPLLGLLLFGWQCLFCFCVSWGLRKKKKNVAVIDSVLSRHDSV